MAKTKKEIDAENYKRLKLSGWIRKTFKLRKEANICAIQAAVDAENNKHIGAIMNAKTDKEELLK